MFDIFEDLGWIGFHARPGADGTKIKNNMNDFKVHA